MPTGESIQQAFALAYSLHPHREVAWDVTREALKLSRVVSCKQDVRPAAGRPYKHRLQESNLLRLSVFMASEKWEKDQESRSPGLTPRYTPTKEDLLYRYVKTLVWHSMDRPSVYAAVGVGSLLFSYRTSEIAAVSADFFDDGNIRRKKEWLLEKVASRFRDLMVIPDASDAKGCPPPSEYQFAFVGKSLATLAPLVEDHPHGCATVGALFEEYFCYDSNRTELERVHLITNADCCGWARLVEEHNRLSLGQRLDDPAGKLRLPVFDDGFDGPRPGYNAEGDEPPFGGRFDADPLNSLEIRSLVQKAGDSPQSRRLPYRIAA